MKILFATNGYKPYRWAGTETYTATIAQELARRGHGVQVLCAGDWEAGDAYWNGVREDVQDGIPVRRLQINWSKSPDPFRYLYDNPVVADYLRGVLRELSPSIVHVTSCETLSASILRVVKDAGVPLVLSLTDFWFLCPRLTLLRGDGSLCTGQTTPQECLRCQLHGNRFSNALHRVMPERLSSRLLETVSRYPAFTRVRGLRGFSGNMAERKSMLGQALGLPDRRITASRFVRDIFIANNVTSPIAVQPYGHDQSWVQADGGKTPSDVVRLGYVGQIMEAKGVHLLLQALSLLPPGLSRRFSLAIYGDVDQHPTYGQRVVKLAAEFANVRFAGTYQHSKTAQVFSAIDVLIVPSLWYDFPLVIHEAFMSRTPVVATDLGGMAETVSHEVNGLLFRRGDPSDLARQLHRLIDEAGLLARLAAAMPRIRSSQEEVDELEALYGNLVDGSPRPT